MRRYTFQSSSEVCLHSQFIRRTEKIRFGPWLYSMLGPVVRQSIMLDRVWWSTAAYLMVAGRESGGGQGQARVCKAHP